MLIIYVALRQLYQKDLVGHLVTLKRKDETRIRLGLMAALRLAKFRSSQAQSKRAPFHVGDLRPRA